MSNFFIFLGFLCVKRDLKELKASKVPGEKGNYKYVIADELLAKKPLMSYGGYNMSGFISIEFSKTLGKETML